MSEQLTLFEDPRSKAELLERIASLEAVIGANDSKRIVSKFRMPPSLADLFALLLSQPFVNTEIVEQNLGLCKDLKVAICRLRKELAPYKIEIKSRRFSGYWLEDDTKEQVRVMIADKASAQ